MRRGKSVCTLGGASPLISSILTCSILGRGKALCSQKCLEKRCRFFVDWNSHKYTNKVSNNARPYRLQSDSAAKPKKCHGKRLSLYPMIFCGTRSFSGQNTCHCSRIVTLNGVTVADRTCKGKREKCPLAIEQNFDHNGRWYTSEPDDHGFETPAARKEAEDVDRQDEAVR